MRNHEVGLVEFLVSDEQDVDVQRARAPPLQPDPPGSCLEPLGNLEELGRGECRIEGDDRVQIVRLRRSADGSGLVHRGYGDDRDAGRGDQAVDRALEMRKTVIEVRTDAEICAPRRRHRSIWTATWSTIARTSGWSLRTVTETAVTRSSTRHTAAIRVADRSSSAYRPDAPTLPTAPASPGE